jgi:hypothetical protein
VRRYRITLTANPDAPGNVPVTLDRLVLDVTIKDDQSPNDLGSWAARQLLVSSYLSISGVEPLTNNENRPVTAEEIRLGVIPGLSKREVDSFLNAIGYFDEQETLPEG